MNLKDPHQVELTHKDAHQIVKDRAVAGLQMSWGNSWACCHHCQKRSCVHHENNFAPLQMDTG